MLHLRGRTSDVVIDVDRGVPVVLHWGAPLGRADLDLVAATLDRPVVHGSPDVVAPIGVVPEHGSGHPGRPGLLGHRRRGTAWAPRCSPAGYRSG